MSGGAGASAIIDSRLARLSPSLWWYRDTCNVYLWTAGDRGLLVDFGSGGILDILPAIGVREIEAVVHTHHHRDQCGGDDRAVELGIPIWVPARERALFEATEAFWRLRRTYDSYDSSSLGFTRTTSLPVARGLEDHERITWAGGGFEVVPTPGHTKGSISITAEIDGSAVAFTGDLIAGHGRVPTLHDLQWQYGMPDAVGAALHSATALARREPATVLPSHGPPIDAGGPALRALAGNLRHLARLLGEIRRNRLWTTWPSSVDQPLTQVLPHLWANTHSVANTYALLDDAGRALILDYGFPSWDHFFADQRFVAHTLDEFRAEAGLRSVVAAIPSHYHDDHLAGVPWLQREHAAEAWLHASFAEIVADPARHDLPCLWPDPIRVDRILDDGDVVEHAGARLETFHMPGHTMFALGLGGIIDGVRVAYTGDNLLAGTLSPLRAAAPIYRNVLRRDSIRVGVERLLAYEPELLLTGHTGAVEVSRQDLDDFLAWARELELVVGRLAPVPGLENEALDPYVARVDPYRASVQAGGRHELRVIVRNHAPDAREALVRLRAPAGWRSEPSTGVAILPADGEAALAFVIQVPQNALAGRTVLTADVAIGDTPRGELAETLLEVLPRVTTYDLVIAGGTVVDPANGLHERRDVGIVDGRIAAVIPHIAGTDANDVLDAAGRLVVPGLVDLHVHVYWGVADLSVEADPTCLGRGATTVVDAGSAGANTFPAFRRSVVEASRGRVLAYLNISATGQIDPFLGELHDLRFADPERAAAVAVANPDIVVGFKVRLSEMLAGPNGLAGLDRAIEAGRATNLPVMVHIGGTPFDIEEVFARVRPRDVITHAYTGWRPGAIVGDTGRVVAGAFEARRRGVLFDVGHGAGSFTWAVAEAALADGFRPDTISSDLHRFNIAGPVHDLATTLSKFILLGLSLDDAIAMATTAPARALGPAGAELGTLAPGVEADVTVLALEDGLAMLVDSAGVAREARLRLVPTAVVRAGTRIPIEAPVTVPPPGIAHA